MTRLYQNSKVKRFLAWLILVCIVMSSFITSTTETAYADSNSRRRTSINLAAGIGFGDINDINSIDDRSLQTIAIYLSNFYLPFVTILDGDYTQEGAVDSGNNQHVKAMTDALVRNCGFKKDVAEFLVGYVLDQSLASCKSVYVKTSRLRDAFESTSYSPKQSYLGFSNGGQLYGIEDADDILAYTPGYMDSSIFYSQSVTEEGGWFRKEKGGEWDYINIAGTITIGGTEYTPVSYSIFMGLMSRLALSTEPISGTNEYRVKTIGDYWDVNALSKRTEFYTIVSDGTSTVMKPVFDTSDVCLGMLMQALQYSDVANGFGTAFSSISGPDIEKINNPEATQYALASSPNVYVNWEGSLIFDNGVYRTVILPGCMNPYMLNTMSTDSDESEALAVYINNTSLSSFAMGYADSNYKLSLSSGTVLDYRVTIGSDAYKFDASFKPGSWGENQSIADLLKSVGYIGGVGTFGSGDMARFPILSSMVPEGRLSSDTGDVNFYKSKHGTTSSKTDIVWYDNFAPITADTGLSDMFKTSNVTSLITDLKAFNIDTYAQFKNVKTQGHALSYPKSTQKLFQNIYLTYCFAAFNNESPGAFNKDVHIAPYRFNFQNFPQGNADLTWDSIQEDLLGTEILSFVYYLLHPTEGIGYVVTLFKNKVSGILLGWHEDIVGATSSNAATGMTKYLGTSSYTTMPNLKDISWVAGLLNIYNNIVVYLIILMCLILLCYVLTGSMTIQRGIVGVVLFGICAFMPPFAINAAVDTINTTSDTIFSKKFDFWAICQMQNFIDEYEAAMEAQTNGNFSSYAAFVLNSQSADLSPLTDESEVSSSTFSGAKVKWMAPKKYNSLASLVQAVNEGTAMGNSSATFLKNSLLTMVAKSTSGETYLDDSDSLYLYRDYADIFKYGHTSYNIWNVYNYGGNLGMGGSNTSWAANEYPLTVSITNNSNNSFTKAWMNIPMQDEIWQFVDSAVSTPLNGSAKAETSSIAHIAQGYLYNTVRFDYNTSATRFSYFAVPSEKISQQEPKFKRNTLAVTYLAQYAQTYREVKNGYDRLMEVVNGTATAQVGDPSSRYYNFGLPKATKDSTTNGSYMMGYQEILGFKDESLPTDSTKIKTVYKDISDIFYGLYSESPFFYFNANIRDQAEATDLTDYTDYHYEDDNLSRGKQETSDGKMNHIAKMFLENNQSYFFNLTDRAGDGYGELRDFTNMHDMFYFVIPYLRDGVELARLYDDVFGLYTDDDCSLIVNANGSCLYDGSSFDDLAGLKKIIDDANGKYTQEQLYKLWHTYNTYTILSAYSPWIDTMLDCDYSKSETIHVMGDKFRVSDPLNPRTYYETDGAGNLTAGRYMVFSKSEMNAMGLTTADLTTVERKIIQFQDNVYSNTLNLMNYYTFSDETMIQAYAMLQTFEFNKLFSQTSMFKDSYVMYPQGYELKAFSYDAYLRMIVSNASGESLMFNGTQGNESIYGRVMKNTSLFFGIFLLLNDILAVYVIPGLKIFFLVVIFFCSVLILIGAVVKMEMNIFAVLWKSLFAPLLSFSAVCIGLSLIVSMFMNNGAQGVASTEFIISVGDPTSAIILMIVLNVLVVVLMFKICKKCFKDLITYGRAVFDNIGSTVVGAVGALGAGFAGGRAIDKFRSGGGSGGTGISRTAKQRGMDNDPRSGRNGIGIGGAVGAGAVGGALGAGAAANMAAGAGYDSMTDREKQQFHDRQNRSEDTVGMNKYDKKAYEGATAKLDEARDKAARDKELAENAKGLRKARYEMAQKLHQRQADSAEIKADNIKKYGTGATSTIEGMKAFAGKGRQTRLDSIHKANTDRINAREEKARKALAQRDAEKAKATAEAAKKPGVQATGPNNRDQAGRTRYNPSVRSDRGANTYKKGSSAANNARPVTQKRKVPAAVNKHQARRKAAAKKAANNR